MTIKVTAFRKNLFRYLDECRDSGSSVYIQRGNDLFRLQPEGTRKPIGNAPPRPVVSILHRDYHLSVETSGWLRAAEVARTLTWTRDSFDRLITAHALVWGVSLLTRDGAIQENYRHAFWTEAPVTL